MAPTEVVPGSVVPSVILFWKCPVCLTWTKEGSRELRACVDCGMAMPRHAELGQPVPCDCELCLIRRRFPDPS